MVLTEKPIISYLQVMGDNEIQISYLVAPIHIHEGELVRNMMTRKLEQDQATEEVRRAINAWLYEDVKGAWGRSSAPSP